MGKSIRLQTALAQLGISSRRGAAKIIKSGRVKVNKKSVFEPGLRVELEHDKITVNGEKKDREQKVYFMLNKPGAVVSTVKDRFAERTVLDLIAPKSVRVYPVGRLDKDTTGLLLLTNDGELAYRLSHPKFGVKKIYQVEIKGNIAPSVVKKLETGILLEGKKTFPCKIRRLSRTPGQDRLEVQLYEGRKRQIKKMFGTMGHPVLSIKRTAFGPLKLRNLQQGRWRRLNAVEVKQLRKAAGS